MSGVFWNILAALGVVHKLRWQDFGFFDHLLPPSVDIFYLMNIGKKWTFLDHLPPSSYKRSLWTAPYPKIRHILHWASSRFSHLTNYFHISENLCWVMILADIEDDQANNFETIGSNHLLSASSTNNKLGLVPKPLGSSDFFIYPISLSNQTDPLWLKTCKNCFKSKWQQIDSIFNDFNTSRLQ